MITGAYDIKNTDNNNGNLFSSLSLGIFPGAFFIAFLSLYELVIAFLNTMYGEQDILSKEFFFFFLLIFLTVSANFLDLLYSFINKFSTYILVLFLVYFFISSLLSPSDIAAEYFYQLFIYIPISFLSGFIAFSEFTINKYSFCPRVFNLNKATFWVTLFFFIISIFILFAFLSTLDSRFIQIATETNIYYQDFGDAYVKAAICVLLLQYGLFKSIVNYTKAYSWLILLVFVQTLLSAVNLVLIGSNKGTALIILVSVFVILAAKPKNWLFGDLTIKKRLFGLLPIIVLLILFVAYQLTLIDITKTRLFDYGNAGTIAENSSFTSRFDQFTRGEGESLTENIIFGKLTIIYLHSSIASLQTHLGLVGSLLLWSFVAIRIISLYKRKNLGIILKGITIPIMLIGAISSFFTWDILWFYFGAISTDLRNHINSV